MPASTRDIVVAITGASGAIYAKRLLESLTGSGTDLHVHLVVSPHGKQLLAETSRLRPSRFARSYSPRSFQYNHHSSS